MLLYDVHLNVHVCVLPCFPDKRCTNALSQGCTIAVQQGRQPDMSDTTLAKVSASDFGGIRNAKGVLLGTRRYIAAKAGLTDEQIKELKTAEVKALIKGKGHSDDVIKGWMTDYETNRTNFFADSRTVTAMLAADPNLRVELRKTVNKAGVATGAIARFRKETKSGATKDAKIAALEAQVAKLLKLQQPAA